MENSQSLYTLAAQYVPVLVVLALTTGGLWLANWLFFHRRREFAVEKRLPRQLAMLLLTGLGIVLVILALPVAESTRGQLLSLLGLLLSAVIAISSTSFVTSAMAGIMLRFMGNFHPGDFIRVGDQQGRVTERGLFHTEIQTKDRDLTTLPNLFLVSHPLTVVHASGTIVSTHLSLGYDLPRTQVESLLLEAAAKAGLTDPFVQIVELGDYAVSYRIAGFLGEIKHLLTTRSNLCKQVLDTLHDADIEIVSPSFMNQRVMAEGTRVIPRRLAQPIGGGLETEQRIPEELIFDKADKAKAFEELQLLKTMVEEEIEALKAQFNQATAEKERAELEKKIARYTKRLSGISIRLEAAKQTIRNESPLR